MTDAASERLLLLAFGILLLGAVVTAALGRDWRKSGFVAVVFTAGATAMLWGLAARTFIFGGADTRAYIALDMLGASLKFHIDKLSAMFLIVVPLVSLAAMLYAVEYMNKVHARQSPRRYYPFALLLLASVVGVVSVSDLFFFFVFWELMTLTSWVLVWFDREDEVKVRAAWTYFIATHVAAACILVAAVVLYSRTGSFAFEDIAQTVGLMARKTPALAHIVMGLLLIGFATKAGVFPFGGWLPQAYPAAPSPASAAFAGSMTKLGIYGIVRVFYEFAAPNMTTVWGGVIAVLGTISIFVGTLTALRQDDTKRLLSFHIIGQIGYMLLGIGIGLFFLRSMPALAAVALIAGLYHLVNNACYKSLLFLNVGAAEYCTGSRDLNKMGGVGALMPVTLGAAIIASLSIAGIPPFSGFVSKWLIYQSAFQGGLHAPFFLILGLVAIFISLVTLASFMKLIGCVFLGKPALSAGAAPAEVPVSMRVPQIALSFVCVLLGVAPILALGLLYGAGRDVLGAAYTPEFAALFGRGGTGVALSFAGGAAGGWNPAYAVVALAVGILVSYAISRSAKATSRKVEGWYGGEEYEPDLLRYRAHGFCLPFKDAFARFYPGLTMPRTHILDFFRKVIDVDSWLFNPLVKAGSRATDGLSRTHSGVPHTYLIWQLVGMIVVFSLLFVLVKG